MPTIAIYPRKSVFTGKGESVQTQVQLCREYCDLHFDNPAYLIYDEDEGYSGANTRRPAFQRMMKDAAAHKFDILCCYRIDRISRNVSDFSRTLEDLHNLRISFISLREQFDTSTPMGRAMMYIASVFAQLERDTIAERVRDNAHFLAQDGHWLGGNTPTGFLSRKQTFTRDGKERTFFSLEENPDEMPLVRTIYAKFLALGSLSAVTAYCLQNHLKSRQGNDFSPVTLRAILTNPVYCAADDAAYEFFNSNDFNLVADVYQFDGIHGVKAFNRTNKPSGSNSTQNDTSDWLITVGQHIGVISGEQWVQAQMIFEENKAKSRKKPRTNNALLSGLLLCGRCGSYMRPKAYGNPLPDGRRRFSYICDMKEHSRGERCAMGNAPGNDVDAAVVGRLTELALDHSAFKQHFVDDSVAAKSMLATAQESVDALTAAVKQKEKQVGNLVASLSLGGTEDTNARIMAQINELSASIRQDRQSVDRLTAEAAMHESELDVYDYMKRSIDAFAASFDSLTQDERRRMLRNIIDKAVWDGKDIQLSIFGEKRLPK